MILWILLGLIVVAMIWAIGVYNRLVQLRENVKNGWSQIDVQLKRRHDLIPNLVETAKGYMAHEKDTLEKVIKARQQAINASDLKDRQQAENLLTSTLRSLFAVSEQYPNLKADRQMMQLHEELTTTENKITFARQYYNDEVNRLNTAVQSFPANVIAGSFNFKKNDFFEIEDAAQKETPKVKF
ncbi:MAG TPA: LemA family protein [Candidatus Omnitrophota bacterium]|nr:LemA family protein [Candidatus Omnitrophota bacterium]